MPEDPPPPPPPPPVDDEFGLNALLGVPDEPSVRREPSVQAPPPPHVVAPDPWTACSIVRRDAAASSGPERTLPWHRVIAIDAGAVSTAFGEPAGDDLSALCRLFGGVWSNTLVAGSFFGDGGAKWLVQFESSFDATRFRQALKRRDGRLRCLERRGGDATVAFALGDTAVAAERKSDGLVVWLPLSAATTYADIRSVLRVRDCPCACVLGSFAAYAWYSSTTVIVPVVVWCWLWFDMVGCGVMWCGDPGKLRRGLHAGVGWKLLAQQWPQSSRGALYTLWSVGATRVSIPPRVLLWLASVSTNSGRCSARGIHRRRPRERSGRSSRCRCRLRARARARGRGRGGANQMYASRSG